MLRVEFHCHTVFSEDCLTSPTDLINACRQKGIDRIIITDHNSIAGALAAKELDLERVIVGEEIMTTAGELLAAFVTEEVPAGLEPLEAIELLHAQGAFISVSHPFDKLRSPWDPKILTDLIPEIDAIEVFNARVMWPGFNWKARNFAREHDLAGTSGSDAHTIAEVGAATLWLDEFSDASGLRHAIRHAQHQNQISGPWVHFASRRAVKTKQTKSDAELPL